VRSKVAGSQGHLCWKPYSRRFSRIGRWCFQQGELRFDVSTSSLVASLLVAAVVVAAIVAYRRTMVTEGRPRDRVILTALRIAALAVVLFCLFRPTLVVRAAVNQQNVVAVLIDDSSSMRIPDREGKPRADYVTEQFGTPTSPLLKSLSDRFLVRLFRFSSAAGRINAASDLTFAGTQTKLGPSLASVREELAGLPVAGVVLVSDGADTSETALADSAARPEGREAAGVHRGRRQETLRRDVQIDRVSTPRTVLKDASLLWTCSAADGLPGRTVTVDVEDEGQIIGPRRRCCRRTARRRRCAIRATATEAGPRLFKFPRLAARRRAGAAEQRARGAHQRPRRARGDPLLRGRAARSR
jgi:hypothetical protein